MAAREAVVSYKAEVEATVTRWMVDYYSFIALEFFKNQNYAEFCVVRDLLNSVLVRPLESSDVTHTKIRVMQFLSRIYDGEHLDLTFESDESLTPLESALMVLENMHQECSLSMSQQDFEKVCTSIKEMMVGMFIKHNQFDKAKEVLIKHFPKSMVGKKAIFMGLIKKKSNIHEVIEQINFQQFKEEMSAFCQSLFPFNVPFLHKAATQLLDKRLAERDVTAAGPDEQHEAGPSSSPKINTIQCVPCKHTIIQRTRLELAYKALAPDSGERTFAQLEEEVEEEEQARKEDLSRRLSPVPSRSSILDAEQDGLFQRDSGSPMEASPADQTPQTDAVPKRLEADWLSKTPSVLSNRHHSTVARLVVEPDSQGSSQCTVASQEQETEVRTEETPQSPNKKDSQSLEADIEVSTPVRKLPRRANQVCSRASTSLAELAADSEGDQPGSVDNGDVSVGKQHNQSTSLLSSSNSTKSEQSASDSEEDPQESLAPCKTPVRKPRKRLASDPLSEVPEAVCITDSSLDSSPELVPIRPVPRTSSTPQKDAQNKGPAHSKWKKLYNTAKESKDTWSDEESLFSSKKKIPHNESTISNAGHRKRTWSESETKKLKEGVKKFGEGNWTKIKSYYSFNDRTNVNLKDRWRTMKKLNMI
ncbi:telomeric repeat binding factor a isoform X2 [Anoplopoma fimbria]|uniref:telomeric repeat binding factor a isoform X2 n=1 Tax=Anoplopoma fimbria TaxID=229290 RepID=UPI0023ED475D|nr:telomeric repeat binding factor a isoform X2 [Anoplopoma fimbria]